MMLVLGAHKVRIRRVLTRVFHLWDGRLGRKGKNEVCQVLDTTVVSKTWIQSRAFRKGARH